MRALTVPLLVCLAASGLSTSLAAQDSTAKDPMVHEPAPPHAHDSGAVAREIRLGDSLDVARQPQAALTHFRAALADDSTNDEALWKAARCLVDIAKQIEVKDDATKKRRDSLYVEARGLAEAATRTNPKNGAAQSMVAQALGRLSRTRGGKERV